MMQYDMIPSWNEDDNCFTMLVTDIDEETYEQVLVGACGDITHWQDDLPSPKEQEAMWIRYWRHVMETGEDPLDQIILPFKFKTRWTHVLWQIAFLQAKSRLSIVCRKGGRGPWLPTAAIPTYVRDYMELDDSLWPVSAVIQTDVARYVKDVIHLLDTDENTAYYTTGPTTGQNNAAVWALVWVPQIDNSVDRAALIEMAEKFHAAHLKTWDKLRNEEYDKLEKQGVH